MVWAPVAFAALLLLAVLYPFVAPRVMRERRAIKAHRGSVVHWYPNYDADLRFEPRMERDIVTVLRRDLIDLGYRPGTESVVVPRTFRRRVAGDDNLRLWTSPNPTLQPVWICCWHGLELSSSHHSHSGVMPLTRELLWSVASASNAEPESPAPQALSPWPLVDPTPELADETIQFACSEPLMSGIALPSTPDRPQPLRGTGRRSLGIRRSSRRARRNQARTHRSRTRPRDRRS